MCIFKNSLEYRLGQKYSHAYFRVMRTKFQGAHAPQLIIILIYYAPFTAGPLGETTLVCHPHDGAGAGRRYSWARCSLPYTEEKKVFKSEPRCEITGLRCFRPGPVQPLKMARGLKFRI